MPRLFCHSTASPRRSSWNRLSRPLVLHALLVIVTLGGLAVGQDPAVAPDGDRQAFMRHKLDRAKEILEGLSLEDYPQIVREAQALSLLTRDQQWNVIQTREYLGRSVEFRRAADALKEAAQKKNLDGATLAYFTMTLKCVECHKYLRDIAEKK